MPAYNADLEKFAGFHAQVVGGSGDSVFSHMGWQKHDIGPLRYPLCSDFYPHGETARKFGVFREGAPIPGINERAVFIVNQAGKIAFSKLYELGEQPPNEDCFAVLRKL